MEPTNILNFTEAQVLLVTHNNRPEYGPLVSMSQLAGCMHFMFSMTTAQARAMAAALIEHATAAEAA